MTTIQRFFNLLSVDRQEIFTLYGYALFNGIISLSLPLGIQAIINLISGGQVSTSWIVLVVFVIAGVGFTGLLQILQLTITENLQQRIFTRSAFEFAYRIPRLKLRATDRYHIPELVNRFFDTLSVQKGLSKILMDFSTASLQVLFGLILLSLYHPVFILFSLALLLIVLLIFRFTASRGLKTSLAESTYKYEVAHWLEELARSLTTFKRSGNSPIPLSKTDEKVSGYLRARKAHFRTLVVQYINLVGFKIVIATGLLLIGGFLVINQQMNIGQFVASEIIIILVLGSVEKLILSMETIYDVLTSIEKIGNVTDLELDSDQSIELFELEDRPLKVTVDKLTFSFPEEDQPLLENLSLNVNPGEKISIEGPIGSGKSMLFKLLAGLHEEYQGVISYNDLPQRNWNPAQLHDCIGDNLDHQELFHGTILENITMKNPNCSMKEVQRLADELHLRGYIEHLPHGYNSMVKPGGQGMPSGIRSKLILLRSLVGKRKLLLMDDPTIGVPMEEKQRILKVLLDLPATILMITTNAELRPMFDRNFLLQDGLITEIK